MVLLINLIPSHHNIRYIWIFSRGGLRVPLHVPIVENTIKYGFITTISYDNDDNFFSIFSIFSILSNKSFAIGTVSIQWYDTNILYNNV